MGQTMDRLRTPIRATSKVENAHLALGYKSWTAYLSDVLSDEPLRRCCLTVPAVLVPSCFFSLHIGTRLR